MCLRLCVDNHILTAEDQTVSSEQTLYPVTNTSTEKPRTKIWRSNGYFEVTTANRAIVFNEGGGDFTALIATGTYTASTLCTAVKTALEVDGAATYTVTYLATKKFQIASSGGTLNIKWTDGGTTAEDLLGFSLDDTGATTYVADYIRLHTKEWIKWDFGIETNPKTFILAGPRNEPLKFSPSSTITLEGNETDTWTSPSYSQALTLDDECLFLQSDDGLHTEPLRYWRVTFVDHNPIGYVEAGTVYLGDYTEFDNGTPQFPLDYGLTDYSEVVISEGGQTFSTIRDKTSTFGVRYNFLQKDEVEEFKRIFDEFGLHKRFFVILDKDAAFSTLQNRMVRFVRFDSAPRFRLTNPNIFECDVSFLEEL